MKSPDDLDDLNLKDDLTTDLDGDDDVPTDLLDDDDLDAYAAQGGGKTSGSTESQLSAKYADYLMWLDTGSSHDEALDLASMSEEEFTTAEADADRSDSFGSLDDEDNDFDDDEDDDGYSGGKRGGRSAAADSDDY